MSVSKTYAAQIEGVSAHIITIEVDISNGLHAFSIVGLGDKSVEESRDRISSAIKNSGFISPKQKNQKVVVSLAPAYMRKEGPAFDLAIAMAYLKASGDIEADTEKIMFIGELSLEGNLRPVWGILAMIQIAKKNNFKKVYIPKENEGEAALVKEIDIIPVNTITEIIADIKGKIIMKKIEPSAQNSYSKKESLEIEYDFLKIFGQDHAKRALEIAAAGKHNIILYGPPGTGKTMLARAFQTILPPLSHDQALEITNIHSVAKISSQMHTSRPFRSPHHTSTHTSLIGGGNPIRPGEISLAHHGVLFMDEFPEFEKKVIDSLRQPLEDKSVTISRTHGSIIFPADFILIASMNPCPCGYKMSLNTQCVCTDKEKLRYHKKISGPISDRIDMWIPVYKVEYEKIHNSKGENEKSEEIRQRVVHSIQFQEKLQKKNTIENISPECKTILVKAAKRLNLSNRSYIKTLKMARTIANLAKSIDIKQEHILEALQYRKKD